VNRGDFPYGDVVIAAVIALLVLVVSPGLAVTAIVALLTLAVCAASALMRRRPGAPVLRRGRTIRNWRR
jgi:hypothetical protein